MKNNKTWLIYILISTIIWSLFPIISSYSLKTTPPFLSLSLSFFWATMCFLGIITLQGNLAELKNKQAWIYAFLTGIFIGVLHYGFYFSGLQSTSPGNVAIVAQTEIFFSFLFFQMWKKESFSMHHIAGTILIVIGAAVILMPSWGVFQRGDMLVLIAMIFAPFGNFYQKIGSKKVSASAFLFMRSVISCFLLLIISWLFGENWDTANIQSSIGYILLNGAIILGINKILWIESIKQVTVTRVLAVSGLNPLFTLLFVWIIGGDTITSTQLISAIPMIVGVYLLSK